MDEYTILKTVEELHLIRCSLLSNEILYFLDDDENQSDSWSRILDEYSSTMTIPDHFISHLISIIPPRFQVKISGSSSSLKIVLEIEMGISGSGKPTVVSFKGDNLSRAEQERWKGIGKEKELQVIGAEHPTYELLSVHLLPLLHEYFEAGSSSTKNVDGQEQYHIPVPDEESAAKEEEQLVELYHALLTSHHLVSPTKRRSLHEWSSSLSISGFAKVGYPGVIYAEGERDQVEEFVANIKSMQWLALRVRFVEPLLSDMGNINGKEERRDWKEFQKVGEVVQEMKRLGREKYVVELGIGSGKAK